MNGFIGWFVHSRQERAANRGSLLWEGEFAGNEVRGLEGNGVSISQEAGSWDPMEVDLTPRQEIQEIVREEIRRGAKSILKSSDRVADRSNVLFDVDNRVSFNQSRTPSRDQMYDQEPVREQVINPEDDPDYTGPNRSSGVDVDPKPQAVHTQAWADRLNGRAPAMSRGLGTTTFGDLCGWNEFERQRQLNSMAAFSVAQYREIDPMDGDDVDVGAKVGIAESIKQRISKLGGTRKSHDSRHRAMGRYHRRVRIVKALVNEVMFESPGIFTASDADKRALQLIVRRVVRDAMEKGVTLPGGCGKIRQQEKAWYLKAVATSYYIREEDDEFWDRLIAQGESVTG